MFARALSVVVLLTLPVSGLAANDDAALQHKLDQALTLVRTTKGFEVNAQRLDALRAKGHIEIAKLDGALAEVSDSETVYVTKKLLRSKSVQFIASTLVHESVHLAQHDERYVYVEEIEFKAYQTGGRFKLKVGIAPETIEKAAMRMTRDQFIREAHSILTGYGGLKYRKGILSFDRENLQVSTLEGLKELARMNGIAGSARMTKPQLVEALVDRLNFGGLSKLDVPSLRALAKEQKLVGVSKMNKSQLVAALQARIDAHRLGVYSHSDLRLIAAKRGIELKPLRSKKAAIDAIVRSDAAVVRPRRAQSRQRHKPRASSARLRTRARR